MESSASPAVRLTEYQKDWIQDRNRFKLGMMARQTGKSFETSLEAVLDSEEKSRTKWVFLSAGERQSKELIATATMHTQAVEFGIQRVLEEDFKAEDNTKYKQLTIVFSNGSQIIGLPANPSTARGHSANVLLDEFAFHKDSRAIWRALYPTITRGFKIRIVSTPQGKKNKFYDLWAGGDKYSHHHVDIYEAVAGGLVLKDEEGNLCTPEDLKEGLDDEEGWAQEYLLDFLDEVSAFLTYDLISTVEHQQLHKLPYWAELLVERAEEAYKEYRRTKVDPGVDYDEIFDGVEFAGDLYLGMDIGRKRDLSVIWFDRHADDIAWTDAVIELAKCPFYVQKKILWGLLSLPGMRRGCIDETGIGAQLAEESVDRFGEFMVEGIPFTNANKEVLAGGLKTSMDDQGCWIPMDQTIRNSLHSVKKFPTPTGHFRFDAERTEKTGHADHFWAKALAANAAAAKKDLMRTAMIASRRRREGYRITQGF